MKLSLFSLFAVVALFSSCNNAATESVDGAFVIDGSIPGQENKTIYVQQFINNAPSNIDSAIISADGQFHFAATLPHVDFYQLLITNQNAMVFIGGPGASITIKANSGNLLQATVSDNKDTELMMDFNSQLQAFQIRQDSIRQQAINGTPQEVLMPQMEALNSSVITYVTEFINQNSTSPAILNAVSKLNPVENLELYKQAEQSLIPVIGHSSFFKAMQSQIANAAMQIQQLEAQKALEAQQELLLKPGSPAPEIAMENPVGEIKKLSDLKGKVVLIDFWASWCKPCRMENPNVVKMYNRYKQKGFEIFSVSLDKNKLAWQNAIREDNLTWTHVSDLQFWQSAAAQRYGVNSIPFTVLIDQQGNVIAKGLRGPQLEQKLKEILG